MDKILSRITYYGIVLISHINIEKKQKGLIAMGYCFAHVEKIHTVGEMTRKYEHNYRVHQVPNAIPELLNENEELVKLGNEDYASAYKKRIKELGYGKEKGEKHIRKNGVLALEVVTTFSREDQENIDLDKWKKDNVEWLREYFNADPEKYGDNILSVMYHGDENGCVHCHAFIVPVDDKGNLNASYYLDGRSKMRQLQDSYGEKMAAHGLSRGLKGSFARHEDIKKFYTALNMEINKDLPPQKNGETQGDYYKRLNKLYKDTNLHHFNEMKKMERKLVEKKTIDFQERSEFYREKHAFEQERDNFTRTFGDVKESAKKLKTINNLTSALENYPDREHASRIRNDMQMLVEWERRRKKNKQNNHDKQTEKNR